MLSENLQTVERKIQDYFLDGEIIEIGDVKFRFAKKGVPFDDGDWTFDPLESGVFQLFNSSENTRPHWVFVGHVDEIEHTVMRFVKAMAPMERESWYIGMTANIALRDINNRTAPQRRNYP